MNNAPYRPNPCPNPRTTGMQCDEYPFYSSELGGAWDIIEGYNSPSSTELAEIPAGENGAEGNALGQMYRQCAMVSGDYAPPSLEPVAMGTPYLTIPLLTAGVPNTFYVC